MCNLQESLSLSERLSSELQITLDENISQQQQLQEEAVKAMEDKDAELCSFEEQLATISCKS